jgi:hypothetical protein
MRLKDLLMKVYCAVLGESCLLARGMSLLCGGWSRQFCPCVMLPQAIYRTVNSWTLTKHVRTVNTILCCVFVSAMLCCFCCMLFYAMQCLYKSDKYSVYWVSVEWLNCSFGWCIMLFFSPVIEISSHSLLVSDSIYRKAYNYLFALSYNDCAGWFDWRAKFIAEGESHLPVGICWTDLDDCTLSVAYMHVPRPPALWLDTIYF